MNKRMWMSALLVMSFFIVSNTAAWAASSAPKIGYFNFQRVMELSRVGQRAQESLKDERNKARAEVEEKAKAYKTAKEEFEKQKAVMDESKRNKKSKEVEQLQQEGEKLLMETNAKFNKLNNELVAPIFDKVLEIVRKMGKDEKYDYILEESRSGLIFANDKNDLSRTVAQELDKSPPK